MITVWTLGMNVERSLRSWRSWYFRVYVDIAFFWYLLIFPLARGGGGGGGGGGGSGGGGGGTRYCTWASRRRGSLIVPRARLGPIGNPKRIFASCTLKGVWHSSRDWPLARCFDTSFW